MIQMSCWTEVIGQAAMIYLWVMNALCVDQVILKTTLLEVLFETMILTCTVVRLLEENYDPVLCCSVIGGGGQWSCTVLYCDWWKEESPETEMVHLRNEAHLGVLASAPGGLQRVGSLYHLLGGGGGLVRGVVRVALLHHVLTRLQALGRGWAFRTQDGRASGRAPVGVTGSAGGEKETERGREIINFTS